MDAVFRIPDVIVEGTRVLVRHGAHICTWLLSTVGRHTRVAPDDPQVIPEGDRGVQPAPAELCTGRQLNPHSAVVRAPYVVEVL